ncbi:30S ribosomal subunit [Cercophora scortea]|uniref:30S ribosomal subunit n=1 Tax=Cercophora scortea TaxID=314031 RepID=A0AAE0M8Q5_9PEZI|nr:30S ribosomal subunit [Cercophora scortea]
MKFRRMARFHGLKRPRIRQTWNKYNLFNLAKSREPYFFSKTFFQQKWNAKAITRGYHGEHIKERAWERMFSRRLLSVVDMHPDYMARHDGSEQAAGRGSGLDQDPRGRKGLVVRNGSSTKPTPYMQMTFAPMERRLDVAIFRALFASSARQARQFVVHGAVKVNGMKMTHPSYLLNPGDMFQVDVESVLTATGRKKETSANKAKSSSSNSAEEAGEAEESTETEVPAVELDEEVVDAATLKEREVEALKKLMKRAKSVIESQSKEMSVKRKKALRALIKDVNSTMSRVSRTTSDTMIHKTGDVVDDLMNLLSRLEVGPEDAAKADKESREAEYATKEEQNLLRKAIEAELENPRDPSKPYATPWTPRPYMSAFAFIPRYLEVNQNICAAVYLRHPVARQGLGEVPTPFSIEQSQLAFNWYLRRG